MTPKSLDTIIRDRHTTKAYADAPIGKKLARELVDEILECAGWAPFHRVAAPIHTSRAQLTSPVPWRCYVLDADQCQRLRTVLLDNGNETKVPRMLAAATTLIQVTWLPNPPKEPIDGLFEPTVQNMEHIAAASAAIQNLLLAATARDIPSYWSSGGALRTPEIFELLGIPDTEILLGSVYLFPQDLTGIDHVQGSLRDKRGAPSGWCNWLD